MTEPYCVINKLAFPIGAAMSNDISHRLDAYGRRRRTVAVKNSHNSAHEMEADESVQFCKRMLYLRARSALRYFFDVAAAPCDEPRQTVSKADPSLKSDFFLRPLG